MTGKIIKIALMGPFGFGNLGDAAIQQAMISNIHRFIPGAEIIGISLNPSDTTLRHGITTYPIGRMSSQGWDLRGRIGSAIQKLQTRLYHRSSISRRIGQIVLAPLVELLGILQAYQYIRDWTVLFASGGGQIDDYWGGAWHHPYTMWLWGILCRLRDIKYRFVSVGAGPLNTNLSEQFVRGALANTDYRSFRDERSRQFMARRGFFRDDPVYPDLAHSLSVKTYLEHPRRFFDGSVVGLGPMAYFDPRVWPEQDQDIYLSYVKKLVELSAWLIERGYRIVLYPGEAVHDRDVINDFLQHAQSQKISEAFCAPSINTVDELMHVLAGVDLVVASRFHGVLLPMLLDKPVLATSYHEKVDELMRDTGQSQYCLPIDSFDVETLKERFLQLEAGQEQSRAQIHTRIEEYRRALDEQYEQIFSNL